MILTNCAACAAPLSLKAPRCVRCHVRYCDDWLDTEHKKAEARAKEAKKSREAADERIARLNSAIGKEEDGHAAEEVAFASLAARQRAVSTAANDCRARGDALRAQLETTTEERDEYQNSVIKLEQELKAAKEERDAATKSAGVIQAKLDAANEEIEKNGVILCGNQILRRVRAESPRRPPRHTG